MEYMFGLYLHNHTSFESKDAGFLCVSSHYTKSSPCYVYGAVKCHVPRTGFARGERALTYPRRREFDILKFKFGGLGSRRGPGTAYWTGDQPDAS